MTPERVQLSRKRGWRMPPNTIKVDRSTRWGNPFRSHELDPNGQSTVRLSNGMIWISETDWTVEQTVQMFEQLARGQTVLDPVTGLALPSGVQAMLPRLGQISTLQGVSLACWCRLGSPCHVDVLRKLAREAQVEPQECESLA